jgi:hypothetical protein
MSKMEYLPNHHLKSWNLCLYYCHYSLIESGHQNHLQIGMWVEYLFDAPMMVLA